MEGGGNGGNGGDIGNAGNDGNTSKDEDSNDDGNPELLAAAYGRTPNNLWLATPDADGNALATFFGNVPRTMPQTPQSAEHLAHAFAVQHLWE